MRKVENSYATRSAPSEACQDAPAPSQPSLAYELHVQGERLALLHDAISKLGDYLQGVRGPAYSMSSGQASPSKEPIVAPAVELVQQNTRGLNVAIERLNAIASELQL